MTSIAAALAGLAAVLDAHGRAWALVGGLAVSCHVDPRFTRDVDVAVAVTDDADAEALVRMLRRTATASRLLSNRTRPPDWPRCA